MGSNKIRRDKTTVYDVLQYFALVEGSSIFFSVIVFVDICQEGLSFGL